MVYLSNAIVTDESVDKIETGIIDKASLGDVDGDGKIIVFMEHIVSQFDVNAYVDEATAGKIQTVMFGGQHTLMLVHRYALEDYDGIFETEAVISVYTKGTEYLEKLGECYEKTGDSENAEKYKKLAREWEVPEIV